MKMLVIGIRKIILRASWRCIHYENSQVLTKRKIKPKTSGIIVGIRTLTGVNVWDEKLTDSIRKQIEKHWSTKLFDTRFDEKSDREKFYILSMFPYPSGSLHMGHVRVYTISDVLARYYRLAGKNVIHPMGWDAFGLPAENAALERKLNPNDWTQDNIANMKALMEELNLSFDWDREFATCDSDYYKWTQFFFYKLYERGLVYRKYALVNWDPVDETVLANEQVDEEGRSWRSGAIVEKKMLKQWFVRTTRFSESLYNGLKDPILEDWDDIKSIQENWIGKVDGTVIEFELINQDAGMDQGKVPIWIRLPEYIDRGKFVAVKMNSYWAFGVEVEGLMPYKLKNPFTNELLPVYLTEKVEFPEGADVHLGIPELSNVDKEFANSVNISSDPGLQSAAREEELLDLREKICAEARERGIGGYSTSSKLQDWLISRQRYWGTPIPIVHCDKCGEQPVAEKDLPVRLPEIKTIEKGENVLKNAEDWIKTNCPKCGGEATRETDTMDTFMDSSWYYLRFLDPDNEEAAFGREKISKLMPVDVYIGGKEHATLHLYYARFMNHFLHSVELVPNREPFKRLLCQGMVRGKTYRTKSRSEYVKPESVIMKDNEAFHKDTDESLIVDWEKMSKSKYNGVEPKDLIKKYGTDTTRLVVLSEATPQSPLNWDEKPFSGILTWQHRLWLTVSEFIKLRSRNLSKPEMETEEYKKLDYFIFDSRNFYLTKITTAMEKFYVSTAISKMQGLTNCLRKCNRDVVTFSLHYERALALQIIMLAPVAPCFASELWAGFLKAPNRLCNTDEILWDKPVLHQPFPKLDENYKARSAEVMDMLNLSKYKSKSQRKKEKKMKKAKEAGADKVGEDVNTDSDDKERHEAK